MASLLDEMESHQDEFPLHSPDTGRNSSIADEEKFQSSRPPSPSNPDITRASTPKQESVLPAPAPVNEVGLYDAVLDEQITHWLQKGVAIEHTTVLIQKHVNGHYTSSAKTGMPPKDERRETNASAAPKITFGYELDEFGNIARYTIDVSWWAFPDFLQGVGRFPLPGKVSMTGIHFAEPFIPLLFRLEVLERKVTDARSIPGAMDDDRVTAHNVAISEAIIDFLDRNASGTRERFKMLSFANSKTQVQYDDIWMLYRPGQLIYEKGQGKDRVCYMVDYPSFQKKRRVAPFFAIRHARLVLHCWTMDYDWDMDVFSRKAVKLKVPFFSGSIEISKLDFLPEPFVENLDAVKAFLGSRGKRFWEMMTRSRFRQVTTSDGQIQSSFSGTRVIVDGKAAKMMQELGLSRTHAGRAFEREDSDDGSTSYSVSSEESNDSRNASAYWFQDYHNVPKTSNPDQLTLLLCPPTVAAFSLRDKSWNQYNVTDLEPVQFAENAWSRLVLKPEYKDVIWAMVKSYLAHNTIFQDLVAGKGDGLVVLLHGPPGVGKTLTAECVAESFKKPLYMVTAGDLGTDPEFLESKLSQIFDYAVAWDAILLLDEADIFLQDRDYDNLQRNALVSIFLRTLEYFNGIMFLTSNRVGAFDQAFQSRIHITIGMPEFDEALRKEVWKIFIKDLGRKRRDGSPALLTHDECRALGSEVTSSWASQPLNGRQIRNCVRSALALAEDKGIKPNASHFNTVIKLGNAFTQYMNKLQKAEAEEIAQIKGDRLAAMKDLMTGENSI